MQNAYAESTTSQLTVSSQLANGTAIPGYFTQLTTPDSSLQTGFTPATFTLNNGETYQVCVADYLNYFFDYWLDTDSTDRSRSVAISEDTQLNAVYRVEDLPPAGGGSVEEQNSAPSPSGTSQFHLLELAEKLAVYDGDNSKVPGLNLSGYDLSGGSQVMQYGSMYELISSGLSVTDTMLAANAAGLEWNDLSEQQQCFLLLVLNLDVTLDENGLPA